MTERMPVGDVSPELVLVVGGVLVLLYALFAPRRLQAGAAVLALATLASTAAVTVWFFERSQRLTFFDTYALDDVALWGKLIVLAATAVVVGLSVDWFRRDPRHGEYYTILLFSALGAIGLAGATDLLELVGAMLLSSVTGYVLTAYHRRSPRSAEAGIKYFLIGALTSTSMLLGVALLFGGAGTTTYPGLRAGLPGTAATTVGVTLVVVALAFKIGAVPAHTWVPDVAEGAPAPVSAFVTTVPKVGGLIALARLAAALPPEAVAWRPLVAVLAAATMTLGNLACLWQDDVRRLIGWSAVSQTGYGIMAVVALGRSDLAVASLLYFLLAYALANLAAFGVVVELRGRTAIADYRGLATARPGLAAALVVAFLSLIGIPPLAGFAAKLLLMGAVIDAGYGWLAALAVANTVVSIVYYLRVLAPSYFAVLPRPVPVLGSRAAVATGVAAVALIVVGVAAEPVLRSLMRAVLAGG